MSQSMLWLIFILIGVSTYLLRASFFVIQDRFTLPVWLNELLRYAPAAVIFALIGPMVLIQNEALNLSVSNERLLAATLAAGVAWWRKSIFLTILVGMLALWLLQWLDFA